MESQRFVEVVPSLVENSLADLELLVGLLHINSFIFVGTAGNQGNELFLPGGLLRHVGVSKEGGSDRISKHELIELINDCVDGCFSSESLVKCCHVELIDGY